MRVMDIRENSGGRRSRKRRRIRNVALAWLTVLLAMGGLMAVGVRLFLSMGYRHLRDSAAFSAPQFPDAADSAGRPGSDSVNSKQGGNLQEGFAQDNAALVMKDGWVRRGDKVYEYIDDILTFLVLGIDIDGPVEKNKDLVSGGQTDAIFLVVMNPDDKHISLIGVNRDTMVEVVMVGLGKNGEDLTATAEISVQHGFGDGLNQSCELTRDAVSELFYNLPIHGYIAFNMGGMAALNDAVGSVQLTVLENMTEINPAWYQGAEVTLTGKDAYEYVHYRNTEVFESARNRLERQKQYLSVFAGTAMAKTKKDVTLPVSLYQAFKPYTVTDISVDEISWLASQLTSYKFDENAIYSMEGITVKGQKFEEFYPDEEALQELIIKVFYREIDPATGKAL